MSKIFSKNQSRVNNIKSQPKKINYQESVISLKNLLKNEIREVKGKDYTDAYIRLLEKKYEKIIEDSINNKNNNNNNEIINSLKDNQLFQKVLNKNKLIIRNQSHNDLYSINKSISNSKILNSSRSFFSNNYSPIRQTNKNKIKKTKSKKSINNSNSNYRSTYWEDYDFLKINYGQKNINKNIQENNIKQIIKNNSIDKSLYKTNNDKSDYMCDVNNNDNTNDGDKYLENYYLYLLNRRNKKNKYIETNEEKKNDKNNIEIMRKIFDKIYNDDKILEKNLEDEDIPEFYKRFIIQDEIKKDNLFETIFKLNYNESQKMKGPQLCNGSRLICKNILNYVPIDKRLDIIIKKKKEDIEEIKKDMGLLKPNYNTSRTRKKSWKKTQDWLKKMDKWNKNKMLKIKKKKEENEKKNSYCSECKFIPLINKNAHLKKEDENIIVSDRLYSNYFTLRQKKENLAKKQQVSFTFRPRINKSTLIKNK